MESEIKKLSDLVFKLKQEIYSLMSEYYELSSKLNPKLSAFNELCEIIVGEVSIDQRRPINLDKNKKNICMQMLQDKCIKKTTYYRLMIEDIDSFFNTILCLKKPNPDNPTNKILLKYFTQKTIGLNCENLQILILEFKNKNKSKETFLENLLTENFKLNILKRLKLIDDKLEREEYEKFKNNSDAEGNNSDAGALSASKLRSRSDSENEDFSYRSDADGASPPGLRPRSDAGNRSDADGASPPGLRPRSDADGASPPGLRSRSDAGNRSDADGASPPGLRPRSDAGNRSESDVENKKYKQIKKRSKNKEESKRNRNESFKYKERRVNDSNTLSLAEVKTPHLQGSVRVSKGHLKSREDAATFGRAPLAPRSDKKERIRSERYSRDSRKRINRESSGNPVGPEARGQSPSLHPSGDPAGPEARGQSPSLHPSGALPSFRSELSIRASPTRRVPVGSP